jgi:hypothetical protein
LGTRRESRVRGTGDRPTVVLKKVRDKKIIDAFFIQGRTFYYTPENGLSLTTCLSKMGDVAAAFAQYEKLRLPRTSRMQAMSVANKTRSYPTDPLSKNVIQKWLRSIKATAWVYNYDAALAVETGDLRLPPDA